jgi:NAD(P)H dehydrogenase (quinone)
VAYVAREDCAAVAAAVLTGSGHENRTYDVTGPELFTARDLATLYGELGGRDVKAESLDDETFAERLWTSADGDDDHARYGARLITSLGQSIREGYMSRRSDVVGRLTQRPARTLRAVLDDAGPFT